MPAICRREQALVTVSVRSNISWQTRRPAHPPNHTWKMKSLITTVVFVVVTVVVTNVVGEQKCPDNWKYYAKDGTCVSFVDGKYNFREAMKECERLQSGMVAIGDEEKNKFVSDLIPNRKDVWIGVIEKQKKRIFETASGDSMLFYPWAQGQPDNEEGKEHCVVMRTSDPGKGLWHDVRCDKNMTTVCFRKGGHSCPRGWFGFAKTGKLTCFRCFNDIKRNFQEAKAICEIEDADVLPSLERSLNNDVLESLPKGVNVWVSYQEVIQNRTFESTGGIEQTYQHWGKIQPNNRNGGQPCVCMHGKGGNKGYWNDVKCESKRPVVCETPP